MVPWQLLDRARIPSSDEELSLQRRGDEYSIRVGGLELMNSRQHGSEEELARLGCAALGDRPRARVLVGGLGMGFTLAAALRELGPDAEVVVAELVGPVVTWNREHLGHLAGHPLDDERVQVRQGDVRAAMTERTQALDAILLDVDNGPSGLTHAKNGWLYGTSGLGAARAALREGGALAVWSVARDDAFTGRLERAGFKVQVHGASARAKNRGARHTLWIAVR